MNTRGYAGVAVQGGMPTQHLFYGARGNFGTLMLCLGVLVCVHDAQAAPPTVRSGEACAARERVESTALGSLVAFGASASFLTPLGYQTNLMVYSAGGYRFEDFLRLGIPVSITYSVLVLTLIPLMFPFY